jgi:hypothetical protein
MLYFNPPYFVINGISVFPDHLDPLQFYYLPMGPHFTTDTVNGAPRPRLQLIEYTGSAGTGGFINFDVNLGLADGALSDLANELQRQAKLSQLPRLSPVTFVDGWVKLVILGSQSPVPTTAPAPGAAAASPAPSAASTTPTTGPQFVVKIQNAAKPALYGDNQATFSVQLDQYGATILEKALQGTMSPIAVIYSLDFIGLRPAFNVHLSIDWNRVQTYLDNSFSAGFLFFSSDIEKTVDKLIENQTISIQIDSFVTDAETSTATGSDRDRAVAECYELIKNNFFESSLQPPTPNQPDDWSKGMEAFRNISDMALTSGAAGLASFSRKEIDISRTDQKHLDFNVSERTTVQRTIYPQGHLSGLLGALQQNGASLGQFVVQVDLDNPFFQRRQVSVVSYADFAGDSIASIDVNLSYNGLVQSVTLSASGVPASVGWTSVLVNGQMLRPVSYTYTVHFKNVDTTQRPGVLTSAALSVVGDVLDIEPRADLYGITVIPIRAYDVPWTRYPSVEVECRYNDPANGIAIQASAMLTSQNMEVDWTIFLRDVTRRAFDYRLTYTLTTGGTSVVPWTTTSDGNLDVVDRFPAKLQLTVLAALDFTVYSQALVYVAYPNKDNPTVQQTYTFNAAQNAPQNFEAERQNATQTLIYYEVRLIKITGQLCSVPGSLTGDSYLILQDGMKGRQIVSIQMEAVDFPGNHITSVQVQLRYVDPANGLNFTGQYNFTNSSDLETFAYDYLNPQINAQYRATIALDNGQTKTIDWSNVAHDSVTIPLDQLT